VAVALVFALMMSRQSWLGYFVCSLKPPLGKSKRRTIFSVTEILFPDLEMSKAVFKY
jgi:hypothetical protein